MSKPPPPPVRVKLYGLFSLTRRGYYVFLAVCGAVLAGVMVWWLIAPWVLGRPPDAGPDATPARLAPAVWVWDHLPWIVFGGALLGAVEVWLVLRKFAREEAAQRARQDLGP